jgi:uncharacterized protein YfdQ (DUF2303 family)
MSENKKIEDGYNFANTILSAGASITRIIDKNTDVPVAVVPDGYKLQSLESFLEQPARMRGRIELHSVDSLCKYVEMYAVTGQTIMFANVEKRTFNAVFNYHDYKPSTGEQYPGWGDYIASLTMQETRQWATWRDNDKRMMGQLEFADFVEDNMADIAEPAAAEILEMVNALKVKKKAEFHSVVDQKTGFQSLQFTEETKGETVKGNIDFMGTFSLAIVPFLGSEKYRVDCRIRFKITGENKLKIFYSIINADAVAEDAFNTEREKIENMMESITVPVLDGYIAA